MFSYDVTRKSFISVSALHKAATYKDQDSIAEYYSIRHEAIKAMRDGVEEANRLGHIGDDILVAVFMQTLMDVATSTFDGISIHIQGFERMVAKRDGTAATALTNEITQTFIAYVESATM